MLRALLPHTVYAMGFEKKLRKIRETEEMLSYADPKKTASLTKKLAKMKPELFSPD